MKLYACFDIETGPLDPDTIRAQARPFKRDAVKTGTRGPEKAEEYRDTKEREHWDKIFDNAAMDARTGHVVAIGLLSRDSESGRKFDIWYQDEEYNEAFLLAKFWKIAKYCVESGVDMPGFNILEFDLPFLVRRSWFNGVKIPPRIYTYSNSGRINFSPVFIDLLGFWRLGQKMTDDDAKSGGASALAKTFSHNGKTEDIGKDFHKIYISERDRADAYLHRDLELNEFLAIKMGIIKGKV